MKEEENRPIALSTAAVLGSGEDAQPRWWSIRQILVSTGIASAVKTHRNDRKVVVGDREKIQEALKRFREMVRRYGSPGTPAKWPKWHKNQLWFYLKPSELRRRDRLRDEWATYLGECARRHLVAVIRRKTKRRKAHFGNLPIVGQWPPR